MNFMRQLTSLSSGQKQRICISKTIHTNEPIRLLDDATAALNTESELFVQPSLQVIR
jgi:ABC-type multidrug transport system fused ATPase/permease subunit